MKAYGLNEAAATHAFALASAAMMDAWVTEAGLSLMYGGIHYRFDTTAGRNLGEAVGQWAIEHADRLD